MVWLLDSQSDWTWSKVWSDCMSVVVGHWIGCMNGRKEKRESLYHRILIASEL